MATTLTIKFKGLEAALLDEMIKSGLFNTKSEAIRSALVKYGMDIGLLKRRRLWEKIEKSERRGVSAKQLEKDLELIEESI